MSDDHAGGNAGVGRDGFVSGVASYDVLARMTDDARQHQHGGPIALQVRKLCERSGIAIDDCARRNAMGALRVSKAFERKQGKVGFRR